MFNELLPAWRCVVICHFIHRTMKEATCIQLLELKVKFSMWLPWRYTGRLEVQLHSFFTLALNRVGWWTSHPSRFTPRERTHSTHSTHLVGGWVDRRAGLDIVEKRIVSGHCWGLNLRLSSLVSHDYTTLVPFPMASYWQVLTTRVTGFYKKSPLCVNLGSKRLYYAHVTGNGQAKIVHL